MPVADEIVRTIRAGRRVPGPSCPFDRGLCGCEHSRM